MTNEQAKNMLKAKLECLKRETSGNFFDCNNSNCDECSLCYEQGNMGEQKEALDMAIKALERQPCEDTISRQTAIDAIMCEPTDAHYPSWYAERLEQLPSVQLDTYWKEQCQSYEQTINKLIESLSTQPEIVRCKDCKFASGDSRICMKFGHSPIGELDFCAWAERRSDGNL